MREPMEAAFAEGNRLGIPGILDTDAQSKCDKYTHPEMTLAGTRIFGEYGGLVRPCQIPRRDRRSARLERLSEV